MIIRKNEVKVKDKRDIEIEKDNSGVRIQNSVHKNGRPEGFKGPFIKQ